MFRNLLSFEATTEKKISPKQFIYIIISVVLSTATIFLPSIVASKAEQDSWVSVILAAGFSIPVFCLYYGISNMFKDKTVFSFLEDIFGKILGKIIAFFYLLFFIHLTAIMIRELYEIMRSAFMSKTPPIVFSFSLMVVASYAVTKGFIAIARMNEIVFPFGMGLLGFVIFFSMPYVKLENFLPILANGLLPPIKGSLPLISWMLESIIILAIFPHVSDSKKVLKSGIISLVFISFALMLGVLAIGIFGSKTTADFKFTALEMTRTIRLSNYFARLDSMIMAVWIEGIFMKITIFLYIIVKGFSDIFNFDDYRFSVLPIASIIVPMSIFVSTNIDELYNFLKDKFVYETVIFEVILPLFIFLVAKLRKLDKKTNVQQKR
ncbi:MULTISPECIES: GerAB/ArcD/ProY family transporter [Thermoanaerobacterium]|jgi:spore germination protein (amino acid permease)|uniref:Spore germination protein KB n=1 Tax=Thermoanaerobacterium butyriciformans TaxID=1702242 RepID=A0ABS4NG09_9THEO|nr:endospore germination permease [Thermoanaerobacterium butyriciformans]MBP2072064.1 spore germination protein KB [Thermoanaerobacterium butyriciformans]WHE07478.1 endospore germination permease [Thermoanaerobacterium thermosaccharolyticum]